MKSETRNLKAYLIPSVLLNVPNYSPSLLSFHGLFKYWPKPSALVTKWSTLQKNSKYINYSHQSGLNRAYHLIKSRKAGLHPCQSFKTPCYFFPKLVYISCLLYRLINNWICLIKALNVLLIFIFILFYLVCSLCAYNHKSQKLVSTQGQT